jgi:hypothetical protein
MTTSSISVAFDDASIRTTYPNGDTHGIAWRDLTAVGIRTTDEGPFAPDLFWGLHGPDGKPALVYPGGAAGEGELLAAMQRRLPGFDDGQVIEAMGASGNAFFLVWKKAEESVTEEA